jgi:type II secretory pathway component PulF
VIAAIRQLDDARERAGFYRAWGSALGAGFAHPKSFETMGPRASPRTEEARLWLLGGTRRGRDVASLVRTGGDRFEEFERALLTLGDEAGQLDHILRLLGDFYTKKHRLMLWVKKQLAYPVMTAFAACFIAPFPLLYFGQTTAYIVSVAIGVTVLLASAQTFIAAVAASYGRRPALARARLARALATAIQAGLPLPRAVRLAADASANAAIRRHVESIDEHRLATSSLTETLAGCPHVTPDFLAVLDTAERSGDFTVLGRLAELYEDGFR